LFKTPRIRRRTNAGRDVDAPDALGLEPASAKGPYAETYAKLKQQGDQLSWQSRPNDPQAKAKRAEQKARCGDRLRRLPMANGGSLMTGPWVPGSQLSRRRIRRDGGEGDMRRHAETFRIFDRLVTEQRLNRLYVSLRTQRESFGR
jgi:hypothetical protein